jgi:hypothetical protein
VDGGNYLRRITAVLLVLKYLFDAFKLRIALDLVVEFDSTIKDGTWVEFFLRYDDSKYFHNNPICGLDLVMNCI